MSILHCPQNSTCSHCLVDNHYDFKHVEFEAGTIFHIAQIESKHIIFFIEGTAKVSCNEFFDREFSAHEMIFIPKSADFQGEATSKCSIIIHTYNAAIRLCDRFENEAFIRYAKSLKYDFKGLTICDTINSFLELLKKYLTDGVNCQYLNELKHKELFLLLVSHHNRDELAQLFWPMIGKSLDLRNKVMEHYKLSQTAAELAARCNYSAGHFNELFFSEFGQSPYKWMQKQKAKHIKWRLAQTDMSIKEIAQEFNFSSQSHFYKYCMAQFGESATQLKARLKSNNQTVNLKNNSHEIYITQTDKCVI